MQTMKKVTHVREEHMHRGAIIWKRVLCFNNGGFYITFSFISQNCSLFLRDYFFRKVTHIPLIRKSYAKSPTFFDKTYAYQAVTQVKVVQI